MHRRGEFVGVQATGGGRYPRAGRPRFALALRVRLEAERDAASGTLDYERAALLQRRIGWLDGLEDERGRSSGPGWSARG